jgi:hypothetical protein
MCAERCRQGRDLASFRDAAGWRCRGSGGPAQVAQKQKLAALVIHEFQNI